MLRWLTLLATVAVVAVNGLANALPINGKTTGQISGNFEILFTPAGYVFSIWGLIYLGLAVFSVAQLFAPLRERPEVEGLRPWYLLSAGANMSWIVAWHYELFALTLVLMLVLLGSLVMIDRRVSALRITDGAAFAAIRVPFSLYFAWICIATIANITVFAWTLGAQGVLSDPGFTLGIVVAATLLCALVSLRGADPVAAGVFVWAAVGIASKNAEQPLLHTGALACAGICGALGVAALVLAIRRAKPRESA